MRATALILLAMSCSDAPLAAEEPVWGKQQCSHCAMLVSEKPPAAQLMTSGSKRRFFDDVGCMVAWESREGAAVSARWVRSEGRWIDPAAAHFSAGHSTPMDFGFLAEPTGALGFDEVRAAVQTKLNASGGHP